MKSCARNVLRVSFFLAVALLQTALLSGQTASDQAGQVAGDELPVKVFILMGQSNMVGMGDISGGGARWGDEFISPVLSIYNGE